MSGDREVYVHLVPALVEASRLPGSLAVVIDVLRATTTIVHALAAGCHSVRPCAEVEEARQLADGLPAGKVLLAGERGGLPVPGFDIGNSPRAFTSSQCKGITLVLTTSNGTRALLRAAEADRVLVAAFVNFSAVCEQARLDTRPLEIVCAGGDGQPCLEDTLLAGALIDFLCEESEVRLNDSARLAWDCFENHGRILAGALEVSDAGSRLRSLGYGDDVADAAQIDRFSIVPEMRRDPLRLEVGAVSVVKSRWQK
jgi:2-phosphosulfolactate phosphatase